MVDLGETLAAVFDSHGTPVDYEMLRREYLEPILALARSLPIFQRAQGWVARGDEGPELQRLLLEGRPIGFDAQTLLLDAFFQNTPGARSFRRGLRRWCGCSTSKQGSAAP